MDCSFLTECVTDYWTVIAAACCVYVSRIRWLTPRDHVVSPSISLSVSLTSSVDLFEQVIHVFLGMLMSGLNENIPVNDLKKIIVKSLLWFCYMHIRLQTH